MSARTGAASPKNDAVEVLRGSAALTVFFYHCLQLWPGFPHGPFALFHQGLVGVDLFLVISGYVTTTSYLALRDSGRSDADFEYWKRRLARIFPLFWLTSVAYVMFAPGGLQPLRGGDGWFQVASHALLLHGLFPETATSINAVTWTLTLEGCLYVFGWTMLRFVDVARRPLRCTVLVFAVVLAYRTVVFTCVEPALHIHLVTQVFGASDGFWLGLVIAVAMRRWRFVPSHLPVWLRTALGIAGVLAAHALTTVMDTLGGAGYWQSPSCVILLRSGLAVAFAALLVVALGVTSLPRVLAPLRVAGTLSYGIYLWHLLVLFALYPLELPPWGLTVTALAATVALSAISYRWFELPIVQRARRPS